jgi:exodeoxyribonuclease VII large subunit
MRRIITVTEINNYIKNILSADSLLSDVSVRGEVSNFKHHYTGHMYFTLKDEGGVIKCVMFKMNAFSLKFLPQDGMRVVVRGYVSVFEKAGQYQLYATEIIQDGAGELHMAFERLKKELQEKGMFDNSHKKQLPFLPSTVCVVTSSTGAVIRDIINVMSRRFPNVHIRLVPTAVQGPDAPGEISRAIRLINEKKLGDVIIVARGGGSIEELWAFNERIVAESIFESVIPVVSAVGHETDFTIADFVADVRAPTPSAAAELVVPEKNVLMTQLDRMRKRLANALMKTLAEKKAMLERLKYSIVFRQPYNRIYQERMQLDILLKSLSSSMKAAVEKEKARFSVAVGRLDSINPLKTIARGFGAVNAAETGLFIKSVDEVKEGDGINVTLADGKLGCTVNGVEKRVWGEIHGKEQ